MEEVFAYLRDVLGVKYLPRPTATLDVANFAASGLPLELIEKVILESLPESSVERAIPEKATSVTTAAPAPAPSPSPLSSLTSLADLEKHLQGCTRCKLYKGRKNIVFGYGAVKADLMFVGEGPGEHEDLQGLPFVGPAGQLLTKMISAMGLNREKVYIANVVKCRPPMNRNPEADEIHECSPFLKMQIKMVDPKLIVALGTFAAQTLLQTDERISRLRGRVLNYENRKVIATYHPSYLLRNPSEKKAAWDDLKLAMQTLGMANPS